ncbi:2-oxoglutarate dehydrogenase E1 subunit family protein, partial [Promicromonospora kroppenstedtii]|uniref:2-oxoglutarate dehydrogenase E1 subunit family protein n=1 Tax=Promicromonospora kroppenstedtii TaxID=440482 RepID=UPI001FDF09D4
MDELYQQYLKDKNAVDPAWWDFFADYTPGENGSAKEGAPTAPASAPTPAAAAPAAPAT